jgi:hypothetical protein
LPFVITGKNGEMDYINFIFSKPNYHFSNFSTVVSIITEQNVLTTLGDLGNAPLQTACCKPKITVKPLVPSLK